MDHVLKETHAVSGMSKQPENAAVTKGQKNNLPLPHQTRRRRRPGTIKRFEQQTRKPFEKGLISLPISGQVFKSVT